MSDDIAVRVDRISKKFVKNFQRSMYYGAVDVMKNMLSIKNRTDILRTDEFWAVQNISFELKRGHALGVIGPNGSGKSTLLRLLNGIYPPDQGRIEIRGHIGALIALGAGFHPLMTGRENIYLNAAILGMSRKMIHAQFDEIIDFAEIGDFLDAPVKTYSSGMYVRLGFAIATQAHPEIMLVDEVLAVGDANFQKKCFDRLLRLRDDGTSLIFISHSMSAVERLCTECLLMKHGQQLFLGNTRECVQRYFHELSMENLERSPDSSSIGVGDVKISDVFVFQEHGDKKNPNIEFGKNIVIEFKYVFLKKESIKNQVRIGIRTMEGRDVQKMYFHESAFPDGKIHTNEIILPLKKEGLVQFTLIKPRLFPQSFRLDVAVSPLDMDVHLGGMVNAATFNVIHPSSGSLYLEYGNMSVTEFEYEVSTQ